MNQGFLVDTDVIVDFLRGQSEAIDFIKQHADQIATSVIVAAELYSGIRSDRDRTEVDDLLSLFPMLPIDANIAREGGLFRNRYIKSHGIGLADALLAATAQQHQLEIKTLNIKHFPMFPELKPAYSKQR